MQTDDLIAALADELRPVTKGWVARRLVLGALGGVLVTAIFWLGLFGLRPDFGQAVQDWSFWMKFFYTLALSLPALWLVARAGRPGADARAPGMLLLIPPVALAIAAMLALAAPGADRHHLLMGHSALFCPFAIVAVSLPVLAGTLWALRQLAPTQLVFAGAAAGLYAGAAGAFVYAFFCTESAVPFVAVWYSLGIVLVAGLGALLGRVALRW